jgi:beta-galactosidase
LRNIPEGVEYHTRSAEGETYEFYINCSGKEQKLSGVNGVNLLNDVTVDDVLHLEVDEVAVVVKR